MKYTAGHEAPSLAPRVRRDLSKYLETVKHGPRELGDKDAPASAHLGGQLLTVVALLLEAGMSYENDKFKLDVLAKVQAFLVEHSEAELRRGDG